MGSSSVKTSLMQATAAAHKSHPSNVYIDNKDQNQ